MQEIRWLSFRSIPFLVCWTTCASLLPALQVHAQQATGAVYGDVAADAAATSRLVIRNLNTGASQTRTPGADGKFSVTGLAPGAYRVELQIGGQRPVWRDVLVRPGAPRRYPRSLLPISKASPWRPCRCMPMQ